MGVSAILKFGNWKSGNENVCQTARENKNDEWIDFGRKGYLPKIFKFVTKIQCKHTWLMIWVPMIISKVHQTFTSLKFIRLGHSLTQALSHKHDSHDMSALLWQITLTYKIIKSIILPKTCFLFSTNQYRA